MNVKIGGSWGANPDGDLARVDLARRTVGDDRQLYVDANGGYTAKQASRLVDDVGVTWFEEPVSSDDHAGLRLVRSTVSNLRHAEYFWDHERIESRYFDGVLTPQAGSLVPADAAGHGPTFKAADADDIGVA